jgi:hypothetical protein
MEWLYFHTAKHETYLQRSALESLFAVPSPSQLSQSPKLNKATAKQWQHQQRLAQQEMGAILKKDQLPSTEATEYGIPPALQTSLEVRAILTAKLRILMALDKRDDEHHDNPHRIQS